MNRENIEKCLADQKNGDSRRKLLAFCAEPRTFEEMKKIITKNLFEALADLKRVEALTFSNGKYCASPLALEIQGEKK